MLTEEQGIGEVTNDEDDVKTIADALDGDGRDLADHRVKGEANHCSDRDAL